MNSVEGQASRSGKRYLFFLEDKQIWKQYFSAIHFFLIKDFFYINMCAFYVAKHRLFL
jgi:hypothetical protein